MDNSKDKWTRMWNSRQWEEGKNFIFTYGDIIKPNKCIQLYYINQLGLRSELRQDGISTSKTKGRQIHTLQHIKGNRQRKHISEHQQHVSISLRTSKYQWIKTSDTQLSTH